MNATLPPLKPDVTAHTDSHGRPDKQWKQLIPQETLMTSKISAALPLWSPDPTLQAPRSQNRYSRTLFICQPVFERGLKFYKFSITIMMLYINSIYWFSKFLYWVGRLYQSLQKYLRCNPWWTDIESCGLWTLKVYKIANVKVFVKSFGKPLEASNRNSHPRLCAFFSLHNKITGDF